MRDLTAELKFLDYIFTLSGGLMVLGILVGLVTLQVWFFVALTGVQFWLAQSVWLFFSGIAVSLIAALARKDIARQYRV